MKTQLEENYIRMIPENFAEKMYFALFLRAIDKANIDVNLCGEFSFSDQRMNVDAPKGGGYLDVDKLVDTLFEAENATDKKGFKIAVEEITAFEIYNHEL